MINRQPCYRIRRIRLFFLLAILVSLVTGTLLPLELYLLILTPLLFVFHLVVTGALFGIFQSMSVTLGFSYTGSTVTAMPEVMEFHRMAGDIDYMLRVSVTDMQAYDQFYKKLIDTMPLKNVTSRFSMERVKSTTAYPIASDLKPVRKR